MAEKNQKRPVGRPSDYTEEIAETILTRLASGDSLTSICAEDGMPSCVAVYRWIDAKEDFRNRYMRARKLQGEHSFDEIADVALLTLRGGVDPQAAKVFIDAKKWQAARLNPVKYGDKVTQEVTGEGGGPVKNAVTIEFVRAEHDKD